MTREALLEKLHYFTANRKEINLELYLLYNQNEVIHTYAPALEEQQLRPKLLNDFLNEISERFYGQEDASYELTSIHSAEANDEDQVFCVPYKEIPKAQAVFGDAITGRAFPYNDPEGKMAGIWAFVVKIGNSEKSLYLFRKAQTFNVIRTGRLYHLFFSNKELTLFSGETIRLDHTFDVMLLEDQLLIINKKEFERSFDYAEAMRKIALDKIDTIQRLGILDNVNKLVDMVGKMPSLRKLLNIDTNSAILRTPLSQMARFCQEYGINLNFTPENKITLKSKKCADQFVKLLNDDYLKSDLTLNRYDSKGKKRIQNKS